MSYSDYDRWMKAHPPEGAGPLWLASFTGREAISELFAFRLELLTEIGHPLDFDRLVGRRLSVEFSELHRVRRSFHGVVAELSLVARDDSFIHYEATLVPDAWYLTRNVRYRIFQQQTVPQILKEVFSGLPVQVDLCAKYAPHNYCVQFGESDFAFASRLMEEEGIHYFFEHDGGRCRLWLRDHSLDNQYVDPREAIYGSDETGAPDQPRVRSWKKTQRAAPGKVSVWDELFQVADRKLQSSQNLPASVRSGPVEHHLVPEAAQEIEVELFPGAYAHRFDAIDPSGSNRPERVEHLEADGDHVARVRAEELACDALRIEGESNCLQLSAGRRFELTSSPDADGSYLLTAVEHEATNPAHRSTGEAAGAWYANRFTCVPRELSYRPPRTTPKPVVGGAQTATVVGTGAADSEEISCDAYGRVKVQFHWDRNGSADLRSSCWLRVAQPWAGGGFGAVHLPRIGHEVVVIFLDSDPDRPIIVGSVFNSSNLPPYDLPKNRDIAGFRSRTKRAGAGTTDGSHVMMIDQDGAEQLHLHAENHLHVSAEQSRVELTGWGPVESGEKIAASGTHPSYHIDATLGSGAGSGAWQDAKIDKTKGNALQTTWGTNSALVLGLDNSVAVGGANTFCAGTNFAWNVGADIGFDIGAQIELGIGIEFDGRIGPLTEWINGPHYEWVNKDVLGVIGGNMIESIGMGSATPVKKVEILNNEVLEYSQETNAGGVFKVEGFAGLHTLIKASTEVAQAQTDLTQALEEVRTAGSWDELSIALGEQEKAQNAIDALIRQQAPFGSALALGYSVVTETGDIVIANLAPTGKITLVADEVEIVARKSFDVNTPTGAGINNINQDRSLARFDEVEEEVESLLEQLEVFETDEEAAATAAITQLKLDAFSETAGWIFGSVVAGGAIFVAAPIVTKYVNPP